MVIDDLHKFRNAMACFASGVIIVTTASSDGRMVGVTVSAFTSLSLKPPMVLICLDRQTLYLQDFTAGSFAVNILTEDQKNLSIKFSISDSSDEWDRVAYDIWETGAPILNGCLANIECDVESAHSGGDHFIIIGRVRKLFVRCKGRPLLYFRSTYAKLGTQTP